MEAVNTFVDLCIYIWHVIIQHGVFAAEESRRVISVQCNTQM